MDQEQEDRHPSDSEQDKKRQRLNRQRLTLKSRKSRRHRR